MRVVTRTNNQRNNRRGKFRVRQTRSKLEKSENSNSTSNAHSENPGATVSCFKDIVTEWKILSVSRPNLNEVQGNPANSNSNLNPTSCSRRAGQKAETEKKEKEKPGSKIQSQETQKNRKIPTAKTKKNRSKNRKVQYKSQNEKEKQEEDYLINFQDLKHNLRALKLLTAVKILPIDLNAKLGIFQIARNKNYSTEWKSLGTFLFRFWQFYAILRIFHLILVSIPSIYRLKEFKSSVQLFRDISTVFMAFVTVLLYFGYIQVVVFDLLSINLMMNSLFGNLRKKFKLVGNENGNWASDTKKRKDNNWKVGIKKWIKYVKLIFHRSSRVSMFIHGPFFMYGILLILLVFFLVDPNSPIFWTSFSLGSTRNLTWICRLLCPFSILSDLLFYFFVASQAYMGTFSMMIFFILTEQQIKDAISFLRLRGGLEEAKHVLQSIKLQILVFNRVFGNMVYLTKLISILCAIFGGFLAIKFQSFSSNPLLAVVTVYFCWGALMNHTLLFDNVAVITDKTEELKMKILDKAGNLKQKEKTRDEHKRICRSVQNLGIQAGGFYLMERENTLIFMDYVVNQVVSLLLTFP